MILSKCGHGKACSDPRCDGLAGMPQQVARCVDAGLWMVVGVLGKNLSSPAYAYTIGLTSLGFPELVMIGVSAQKAAVTLNSIGEGFVDKSIKPDHHWQENDIATTPVRLIRIGKKRYQYMNQVLKYYKKYTAMQVVIPDDRWVFPGEDGFNHAQMQSQILLS